MTRGRWMLAVGLIAGWLSGGPASATEPPADARPVLGASTPSRRGAVWNLPAGPASQPAGATILGTRGSWRCFTFFKTEVLHTAGGQLKQVRVRGQRGILPPPKVEERTALPPADWASPDFDDFAWARFVGGVPSGSLELAVQCIRGKFMVNDPVAVRELKLSIGYRGGAVVYMNGQEVARGNLPAGRIDFDTLAEEYLPEAYVKPDNTLLQNGFGDPANFKDRFASRTRRLDNVAIPVSALRKGVNVLAIELHRAPTAEVLLTGRSTNGAPATYCMWSQLGLEQAELTAASPSTAIVPNVAAPAGLQAFTHQVVQRLSAGDWGDPAEKLPPVRIAAARNGEASGMIVLGANAVIRKPAVVAGELRQAAGKAVIPAAAIQLRYGIPDGVAYGQMDWHEGCAETAPAEVPVHARSGRATLPVWVTVRVPGEATAGDYDGKLTLTADGSPPIEAAIRLSVADWVMPDAKEFASHVGIFQSPDSLALRYNVPLWSPEHWKLLDKCFAQLGRVGADDVYIPLICNTYLGNEQTMVRWSKQPDGGFKPDFSIAEKYLDLAISRLGRPPVVCLYIWDGQGGTWSPTSKDLGPQKENAMVASVGADGKADRIPAPKWGEPGCMPFWKPAIDGMRDRLKQRGLANSMMIGVAMDNRPMQVTVDELKALAPECRWVLHSHMSVGGSIARVEQIAYGAHVWCSYRLADPDMLKKPAYGWRHPYIYTAFPRYGAGGVGAIRVGGIASYRCIVESLLACGHRGVGRIGADFWDVVKDKSGRMHNVLGNVSVTLMDSTPTLLSPGADGPISTARFEMLREGVQEAEARIFIEKALADPAARARLGDELASKCQALLDGRVRFIQRAMGGSDSSGPTNWALFQASEWQEQSRRLYDLAALAARAAK